MKCPYCFKEDTKVVDKRDAEGFTRRRRECLKCGKRFTTFERVENVDLIIVKKGGERERYEREKLKQGVIRACEKRPVSIEKIENVVDKVEKELRNLKETEIDSKKIGNKVMKHLKKLDKVAYIRFASVYKDFKDVEEFEEELNKLNRR